MTALFVVWGPTAEWGDGSGPLFYTLTQESAESYIEDEKRATVDHASQVSDSFAAADSEGLDADYEAARIIVGWPSNQTDYGIEETLLDQVLSDSGFDGDSEDEDAVFEYLNQN